MFPRSTFLTPELHHSSPESASLTLARRMTLTFSPIQMTKANFSRNECSSLAYFTRTKPNEARAGSSLEVNSDRPPVPVAVRVSLSERSDWGLVLGSQRSRLASFQIALSHLVVEEHPVGVVLVRADELVSWACQQSPRTRWRRPEISERSRRPSSP